MFHKEGYKIIVISMLVFVAILFITDFFIEIEWLRKSVMIVFLLIFVLILQFFRNPKRVILENSDHILAAVDGKVVVIEEVKESEYFQDKRRQISIFMSPLNVHVTRYPISGKIIYSKYHPGKYLVAWHPKSSQENERTTVVIESAQIGQILYRQIAGAMAKRIVNYAIKGEQVNQGEDSGFIKFGSRVDIFIPLDMQVNVSLNEKVKGGETIIAQLNAGTR